jgi:8-oxo-dGTP diphosphatase
VTRFSGDGFITLADGSRRWGKYGAAGVLARHVGADGTAYFVALRSEFTHQGGTWAIPGGALDSAESPVEAALREFSEEIGVHLEDYEVVEVHEDDHGGWSYWTVVIDVPERFEPPSVLQWETADVRWVRAEELAALRLFGAFRDTLERLGVLD